MQEKSQKIALNLPAMPSDSGSGIFYGKSMFWSDLIAKSRLVVKKNLNQLLVLIKEQESYNCVKICLPIIIIATVTFHFCERVDLLSSLSLTSVVQPLLSGVCKLWTKSTLFGLNAMEQYS